MRPVRLDARTATLARDGEQIALPPLEFKLLAFLMQNRGRHFTAKELYRRYGERTASETRGR